MMMLRCYGSEYNDDDDGYNSIVFITRRFAKLIGETCVADECGRDKCKFEIAVEIHFNTFLFRHYSLRNQKERKKKFGKTQ